MFHLLKYEFAYSALHQILYLCRLGLQISLLLLSQTCVSIYFNITLHSVYLVFNRLMVNTSSVVQLFS